ncbi:hypothetical protein Csa_019807, partial [Cucumis sativus]
MKEVMENRRIPVTRRSVKQCKLSGKEAAAAPAVEAAMAEALLSCGEKGRAGVKNKWRVGR